MPLHLVIRLTHLDGNFRPLSRKPKIHILFYAASLTFVLSDDTHNTLMLLLAPSVASTIDLVPKVDPLHHRGSEHQTNRSFRV